MNPDSAFQNDEQLTSSEQQELSISFTSIPRDVSNDEDPITGDSEDPLALRRPIRGDISKRTLRQDHHREKFRKIRNYYNRQNALIDAYLRSLDEEAWRLRILCKMVARSILLSMATHL
jgi:hypothetical protein